MAHHQTVSGDIQLPSFDNDTPSCTEYGRPFLGMDRDLDDAFVPSIASHP